MPIFRRRGENAATVALIPSVCHQRLVVYSRNDNTSGWAIRDFLTNKLLENERSGRVRLDIETEIDLHHSEYPPFYAVDDPGHAQRWELYLILRTLAHLKTQGRNYDLRPVVSAPGDTWADIMTNGWTALSL
jgi:hypothetical protein